MCFVQQCRDTRVNHLNFHAANLFFMKSEGKIDEGKYIFFLSDE